jgi:glycerol-3-phosphate O-acyltransferase / dihydroxyacetone phosphate acyltransferase
LSPGARQLHLLRMDVPRLITRIVGRAAGVFQTIERLGNTIPPGPVLVVANHPNSLIDPLVIFRVAGRPTRPLAKAPLFEQRFVGTLLRGLGGLPVYRAVDDPAQMHRNEETFRGAVAALCAGDAVQIYPEGRSHSEPSLGALKTGAARIALAAEAESDWTLGLQVVPVGLTFQRKNLFRGRVLAVIAEPFAIADYRQQYEAEPVEAVRALTRQIAERLHAVTVNVAEQRDAELIDTAERLYVREKGVTGWRTRDALAARVPRLQAFARGLAWLRDNDPRRHERLSRAVARYRRRALLLGVQDADVPPHYTFGATLSYTLAQGTALLLLAPVALLGTIVWAPAHHAPRLTLRLVHPELEAIATYKLATAFVVVPLTLALGMAVGAVLGGITGVLIAAAAVPMLGLATIYWYDRLNRVLEDGRIFVRVLTRADHRDRLARDRGSLVEEFDAVVEEARLFDDAGAARPPATP